MAPDDRSPESTKTLHRRIGPRTSQLNAGSTLLYGLEHYSSSSAIALTLLGAIAAVVIVGVALGFPQTWVSGVQVGISVLTLVMVLAIQHTQGREQTAMQRKLDELLRAIPGAEESLVLLEEAPQSTLLEVEETQRDRRANQEADSSSP
jgi:low affinity Fe/Cu permease